MTTKILIVYYSANGSTAKLAHEIGFGVEQAGAEAVIRQLPRVTTSIEQREDSIPETGDLFASVDELLDCDGLALGSPVRFGNMAAAVKHFIDQTSSLWLGGKLAGKPACVFTSGSSLHGGQESTLLSMLNPLLHHGMMVCGLPYTEPALMKTQTGGTPYGVSHWNGAKNDQALSQDEILLARLQGRRLAEIATRLKS